MGVVVMFKKKPAIKKIPEGYEAVLHVSICTGETAAGFLDTHTGHFKEVQLIQNEHDLQDFMKQFGIENSLRKIY